MKRIKKRYLIPALGLVCLATAVLLWCKLDGVVSVHRGFSPGRGVRVHNVRVRPYLRPATKSREPGTLFKQRLVWSGPHMLRISMRDYAREFQKARLIRCRLQSSDGAWAAELAPSAASGGWHEVADLKWTDEFNEIVFIAVPHDAVGSAIHNIDLPAGVRTFSLELHFELAAGDYAETFEETITLRRRANSYQSYGLSRMMAH
jgi:hypothetical protein